MGFVLTCSRGPVQENWDTAASLPSLPPQLFGKSDFIIFFLQQNPQNRLMGSGWGLGCHYRAKWDYLSSPQLVSALIFGVWQPGRGWHWDAGLDAGRGLRDGDRPQTGPGPFAPLSLPFTLAIRDPEPLPRDKDPLVPCYSWTRLSGTPGDFAEGQLINPHTPGVGGRNLPGVAGWGN